MSYGIGAELLRKMGYVDGEGLGRDGSGITKPIEVNFTPKGMGIGALSGVKSIEEDYYYSSEDENEDDEDSVSRTHASADKKTKDSELEKNMLKLDVSTKDENDAPKMKEELVQYGILQFSDRILNSIDKMRQTRMKTDSLITANEIAFVKARKTLQGKQNEIDDERTILIEFVKLYKRFMFAQQQLSEEETCKKNLEKTSKSLDEFEKHFSQIEIRLLELKHFDSISEYSTRIESLLKILCRCIGFINNEFKYFEINVDEINYKFEMLLTSIFYEAIPTLIQWFWISSTDSSSELDNAFVILADEIFAWGQEIVPTLNKYTQNNNSKETILLNLFDSIVAECLFSRIHSFVEKEWQKENVNSLAALNIIHTCRKIFNIDVFNYLLFSVILPKLTYYFQEVSCSLLVVHSSTGYTKKKSDKDKMSNFLNWADLLVDDVFIRNEFIDRMKPVYERYFEEDFIKELNSLEIESQGEICILGFNEIFLNGRSDNEKLIMMKMLNNSLLKNIIISVIENDDELDGTSFLSIVYGFRNLYSSMKRREKLYEVLLNEVFIKCLMARQYIKVLHNSFVDSDLKANQTVSRVSLADWFQQRFLEIENFTGKVMRDLSSEIWVSTEKILVHFFDTLNNCIDMYEVNSEKDELEQYIQSVSWDVNIHDVINKLNHSLVQ